MAARAEADGLRRIVHLPPAVVVLALEPGKIDEHRRRRRLAGQRRNDAGFLHIVDHRRLHHDTGHGFTCQMSAAYSAIVRSLENFPEPPMLRIAFRAHAARSAYSAVSFASASR